jgi:S-disulfanyl-L-cysteine oxidoreductase SoxD
MQMAKWRMFMLHKSIIVMLAMMSGLSHAQSYQGIGHQATQAEVKAWNIDVRSDFQGLPKGAGSALKGAEIWDGKCASCHGAFGESNQVFAPLVGGTTKEDMAKGRVAALTDGKTPYRTTLMKVSQVSTLWDYINRAMPWNAPKSLSTEEVYAVTAYLLSMGGIVADDFVLSSENIAQVQATMPNRNGKTTKHGMWDVKGKPDVQAVACMRNCGDGQVVSHLPDYARNAHGNLAEQNRIVGPYRGVDTSKPLDTTPMVAPIQPVLPQAANSTITPISVAVANKAGVDVKLVLSKNSCTACHGVTNKIVGPAFSEIVKQYTGKSESVSYLSSKIKQGGQGVWGATPMPPQTLSDADAKAVAEWLVKGMK